MVRADDPFFTSAVAAQQLVPPVLANVEECPDFRILVRHQKNTLVGDPFDPIVSRRRKLADVADVTPALMKNRALFLLIYLRLVIIA